MAYLPEGARLTAFNARQANDLVLVGVRPRYTSALASTLAVMTDREAGAKAMASMLFVVPDLIRVGTPLMQTTRLVMPWSVASAWRKHPALLAMSMGVPLRAPLLRRTLSNSLAAPRTLSPVSPPVLLARVTSVLLSPALPLANPGLASIPPAVHPLLSFTVRNRQQQLPRRQGLKAHRRRLGTPRRLVEQQGLSPPNVLMEQQLPPVVLALTGA